MSDFENQLNHNDKVRIERALAKLEQRANRGSGFSNYARQRLDELKQIEAELTRVIQEQAAQEPTEVAENAEDLVPGRAGRAG
jgi:hypothetical protein